VHLSFNHAFVSVPHEHWTSSLLFQTSSDILMTCLGHQVSVDSILAVF
jgi:hypothetical protein